jgi:hypothetical protein
VDPENLTCTAGAGSVVDLLFHCVASPGDGEGRASAALQEGARRVSSAQPDPQALYSCTPPDPPTFAPTPTSAGVLIPAPYYPAFDNDLVVRDQVRPVPVYLAPQKGPLAAQLDAAAAASEAAGHPIRALLISNPSNPMGTVMPEGELREMMAWCLAKRVHLVR